MNTEKPDRIIVHGARVHNLKNIDVEVPLKQIGTIITDDERAEAGKDRINEAGIELIIV